MENISFIKRLSDEEIREFIESRYPKSRGYELDYFRYTDSLKGASHIYIDVSRDEDNFNLKIRLDDFETSNFSKTAWVNFLYKKFGDEYHRAYYDQAMAIFIWR